jgi:hypothetical protein
MDCLIERDSKWVREINTPGQGIHLRCAWSGQLCHASTTAHDENRYGAMAWVGLIMVVAGGGAAMYCQQKNIDYY